MGVSTNGGTPKSSILMGYSLINHPFWGNPHDYGNPHMTNFAAALLLLLTTLSGLSRNSWPSSLKASFMASSWESEEVIQTKVAWWLIFVDHFPQKDVSWNKLEYPSFLEKPFGWINLLVILTHRPFWGSPDVQLQRTRDFWLWAVIRYQ